jgi:hypothetical protein
MEPIGSFWMTVESLHIPLSGMKLAMETPNAKPRHRRCQFGLRKLLLWTAVVAVLLGIATTTFTIGDSLLLTCWIVLVGAIRLALGTKAARMLSVVAGMMLGGFVGYFASEATLPGLDPVEATVTGLTTGFFCGLATFVGVEVLVRVVNWVDKVFEAKSDGRG